MLLLALSPILLASTAACDKDDTGAKESEDGGNEDQPDTGTPLGSADAVLVDIVLDDAKGDKVANHGYQCDDEGEQRHHRGQEGADNAREDAKQEGDEAEACRDRVQDHDSGQTLGSIAGRIAEVAAVKTLHETSRVISNLGVSALIRITTSKPSQYAMSQIVPRMCCRRQLTPRL